MALNPASYNPAGAETGPATEPPPPTSSETTAALLGAAKDDPMGQHEGGQDKQGEGALDKLEKEKEKDKDKESGGGGND
ncbi:hypothetical protein IMSHALPRED_009216 [Imshaugia aleurites]|uniref:Uncharacterized protein n=1 Tax=Imshaugia aleurites TaxID=172621 RepID=A0A8H3IEC1_9LECA|nr:hypothetical protein IMSHALPRED_009216 [Imshaugia aleurites]